MNDSNYDNDSRDAIESVMGWCLVVVLPLVGILGLWFGC